MAGAAKSRASMAVRFVIGATLAGLSIAACSDATPEAVSEQSQLSPALAFREDDPSIVFTNLADGDVVTSPVRVEIETNGVTLAPAGDTKDGYGHWHLLIDRGCVEAGQQILEEPDSLHIGTGDDHLTVDLEPGTYELCAQLGDGFHVAVNITDTIMVEVVE